MAGHAGVKLDLKEEKVSLTAGQTKEYQVIVTNTGTEDDTIRIKVDLVYNSEIPDPPEWTVKLYGVEEKVWDVTFTKVTEKEFRLIADGQREVTLTVTCPKGARYGDRLNVVVNAISKGDPGAFDAKTLSFSARQAVLAVKSSIGHDRAVADAIYARAKAKDVGVFSILVPANFRGYVYVESMNPDCLAAVVPGLRRGRRRQIEGAATSVRGSRPGGTRDARSNRLWWRVRSGRRSQVPAMVEKLNVLVDGGKAAPGRRWGSALGPIGPNMVILIKAITET